jgi:fucose 4-O-acetylase-like acetyltransferase
MFKNKMHIGQILGLILLAPFLVLGLGMMNDFQNLGFNEEFIFMLAVFSIGMANVAGLMFKKYWALELTSFLLIGLFLIALWAIILDINLHDEPFTFAGLIFGFGVFCFGSVALLNNELVLNAFGQKETYHDLDDILDDNI